MTILEIVIVLCIILLVSGLSIPAITSLIRGERLRAAPAQLEAMAITARAKAFAEHRNYRIVLLPDAFHLERDQPGPDEETLLAEYRIPARVEIEIATWPGEIWVRPSRYEWEFPPAGLLEPLRIMFRDGDSYYYQEFSAITGWERDHSSYLSIQ